jgi:prepilin-type N-terminal cleavage/methylation domain-containing protein
MMIGAISARRARDEAFTLIEAVVALMVVSILVAVAIPAFQGFHRSAQDRVAQGEIDRVLLAERAFRQGQGEYTDEAAAILAREPEAVLHDSSPVAGVTITVNAEADALCLERTSASGAVFGVWESAAQGTFYGRSGALTGVCPEAAPAGFGQGGW